MASVFIRGLLVCASVALISWWAQDGWLVAFLAMLSIVSFGVMAALKHLPRKKSIGHVWGGVCIAVLFASVPLLNLKGWVGTLTGSSADQTAQLPWLLGLPFLILQMAAIWREVLVEDEPLPEFVDYALLLTFFPKYLSGPLERMTLIKDFHALAWPDGKALERGFGLILLGLFMKFAVANQIAVLVNLNVVHPPQLLVSVVAFELRVYFDLAGYSFMALGGAHLFGVRLTCNFRHPFYSPNVREFWQRWHVSLGRWLHATVFQPIRRSCDNRLLISYLLPWFVFSASALWHGTTVNFLLWGTFHACCFVAYVRYFRFHPVPRPVGIAAMVSVILFGRLLFMDSNYYRLGWKILAFADLSAWRFGVHNFARQVFVGPFRHGFVAMVLAAGFLATEGYSLRRYPDAPYQVFLDRRVQLVMMIILIGFTQYYAAGLVYARQ